MSLTANRIEGMSVNMRSGVTSISKISIENLCFRVFFYQRIPNIPMDTSYTSEVNDGGRDKRRMRRRRRRRQQQQ